MRYPISGIGVTGWIVVSLIAACANPDAPVSREDHRRNAVLREFVEQGYPPDFGVIAVKLRANAENGSAPAKSDLGLLYANGWGVPRSDAEAARWYLEAGIRGLGRGKYNLALMYLMGRGVAQDYDQSLRWMLEAAMTDHRAASEVLSCLRTGKSGIMLGPVPRTFDVRSTDTPDLKRDVGFFYWRRSCDPVDTAKAVALLTQAAEAGLPKAQYMLGIAHRQGRGVLLDFRQSATWFRRAAAGGHAAARRAFCELHRAGHVPDSGNDTRARAWCD